MRKYEYETGRFISIDPLWGKYYGWTPYQYSMNSPVMLVDVGGEDVVILSQPEGANGFGHAALLVGNDKSGWQYISKDGTSAENGLFGPSKRSNEWVGKTLNDALGNNLINTKYSKAFRIYSSPKEDKQVKNIADDILDENYNICTSNCGDVVSQGLSKGLDNPEWMFYTPTGPNALYQKLRYKYRNRGKDVKIQKGEKDPNDLPGKENQEHKEYDNSGKNK